MIKVLGKKVLLEPVAGDTVTAAGIIINEKAPVVQYAKVLSVGGEVQDIKPSDTVVILGKLKCNFSYNNKDYFLLRDTDIMAVKE